MKKITLLFVLTLIVTVGLTQKTVNWINWSNPTTFQAGATPVITGFGEYSDSLSGVYDGKTFFANNNEYYQIESWADYYYWYTQKYWYKFKQPEVYEFFYLTENDYEMARYVATQYEGKYYPSNIIIELNEKDQEYNRTLDNANYAGNIKKVHELEKDLTNPLNAVKVRAYSYDINSKHTNSGSIKEKKGNSFDYNNPRSSGIRTFNQKTKSSSVRKSSGSIPPKKSSKSLKK